MEGYDEDAEAKEKEYTLAERTELRFECDRDGGEVTVELLEGTAEIFGWELQLGVKVNVTAQKLPVFTWKGCRLKVDGFPRTCYIATETPNAAYLELHSRLNTQRQAAQQAMAAVEGATPDELPSGPRVIILGPTDSGKSSLTRSLLNWGVRSGWQPTYVDVDVGQGSITAPGCISAVPVEAPLDPEEGAAALDLPLVLFYGHASPKDNPELYKFLIDRLASILEQRAATNPQASASGLIINTLGWVENVGQELQEHTIQAFKADIVLVIDQDRLHNELTQTFKGRSWGSRPIQVIKLPKSGGVVKREQSDRTAARRERVTDYFYGPKKNLMPSTATIKANDFLVFKVGASGPVAPTSAMPIGASAADIDPLRVSGVTFGMDLAQSVLAVSHAEKPEQLLYSNVAGFIWVQNVDPVTSTVTILAPSPGALPGRYLLAGSLKYAGT